MGELPVFNPSKSVETSREPPGEGDDIPCESCGAAALDTGLECSNCGHDNYRAVTGQAFKA